MKNRELIKEFIERLIQNENIRKPYDGILNDCATIYDAVFETECFAAKLLGIPEDIMDYLIREYVCYVTYEKNAWNNPPFDENDNPITDIEALVDCVIRYINMQ